MRIHRRRSAALAALAGLVLGLTGCEGGDSSAAPTAGPGAPSSPTAAPPAPSASPSPSPSRSGTPAAPASEADAGGDGKGPGGSGGPGTDDGYAYTHPCSARNLTVKVTAPEGFPATVRVVTVTNNGSTSCGLDLHPAVGFSAKGAALGIQATPPEGIGGPAHPVRPGATAYAAVDLDPSGAGGPVADEINVLADGYHMPNADGVSLPLATPGPVVKPKVGLYHFTARDSFQTLR
ncbi:MULTISPECIES: DUF4232 domain-containing protein [Streptomyces]|uniref:DUF4232 domain-containing protein n=1 Tax=Streptomyces TaxID=1883 RepID=UPI000F6F6AD6|nr:DUF4232 domain-containing protein [Streptomyces sp. W1SF4]AZM92672.1 DUF4232 domain-containing protein [Streptomyces sp. W1SF4]